MFWGLKDMVAFVDHLSQAFGNEDDAVEFPPVDLAAESYHAMSFARGDDVSCTILKLKYTVRTRKREIHVIGVIVSVDDAGYPGRRLRVFGLDSFVQGSFDLARRWPDTAARKKNAKGDQRDYICFHNVGKDIRDLGNLEWGLCITAAHTGCWQAGCLRSNYGATVSFNR